MKLIINCAFALLALGLASAAAADAPLKSSLDLTMDQAKQVQEIQAKYRKEFRSVRGDYNRESRALRRARVDNDAATVEKQEEVTAALEEQLRAIKNAENAEIYALLSPEQSRKFDQVIAQRRAMVGSSRDANIFD